jgi:hypothetical protein
MVLLMMMKVRVRVRVRWIFQDDGETEKDLF